jgi:hypothetical protein
MSIPHRNDPSPIVAWRPDNHHELAAQATRGDVPRFAVVAPLVRQGQGSPDEHRLGIGEVESPPLERLAALALVSGVHELMYIR